MKKLTIEDLHQKLIDAKDNVSEVEFHLQLAYNEEFNNSKIVKQMISEVENSNKYCFNEYGEICSIVYNVDLSNFKGAAIYFVDYMKREHFIEVDFMNETMTYSQGDDCLIIQDDTRHDNGVWCGGKRVIKETEYKNEETNEVNEEKRNNLIEKYMEKTGWYPGVFRCDQQGNVFSVNTQKKD